MPVGIFVARADASGVSLPPQGPNDFRVALKPLHCVHVWNVKFSADSENNHWISIWASHVLPNIKMLWESNNMESSQHNKHWNTNIFRP
jgi:hypothetical protein